MSLPPELILEILEIFLARSDYGRSAGMLAAFCRASTQCNALATRLLYRSVVLVTERSMERWAGTLSTNTSLAAMVIRLDLLPSRYVAGLERWVSPRCVNLVFVRIVLFPQTDGGPVAKALAQLPHLETLAFIDASSSLYICLHTHAVFPRLHHLIFEFRGLQSRQDAFVTAISLRGYPPEPVLPLLRTVTIVFGHSELHPLLPAMIGTMSEVLLRAPNLEHAALIYHPTSAAGVPLTLESPEDDVAIQQLIAWNDRRITLAVVDPATPLPFSGADPDKFQPWRVGTQLLNYD